MDHYVCNYCGKHLCLSECDEAKSAFEKIDKEQDKPSQKPKKVS